MYVVNKLHVYVYKGLIERRKWRGGWRWNEEREETVRGDTRRIEKKRKRKRRLRGGRGERKGRKILTEGELNYGKTPSCAVAVSGTREFNRIGRFLASTQLTGHGVARSAYKLRARAIGRVWRNRSHLALPMSATMRYAYISPAEREHRVCMSVSQYKSNTRLLAQRGFLRRNRDMGWVYFVPNAGSTTPISYRLPSTGYLGAWCVW